MPEGEYTDGRFRVSVVDQGASASFEITAHDGMQLNEAQYNTDTKGCALPWLDPHAHPTPSPPSPPKPSPPPPVPPTLGPAPRSRTGPSSGTSLRLGLALG